ncbi:MAG: radical SAM protein [Desulfovibrio sp.]|nr:radical SAM protein [Desulfovibrio sp.]
MKPAPRLLIADNMGNITTHPRLKLAADRGGRLFSPDWNELVPLPDESELFFLPGRRAIGLNPSNAKMEIADGLAVAAFAAPGYTLSATPAYAKDEDAPVLPLFAYGSAGYSRGKIWICASRVDEDRRQIFSGVPRGKIEREARRLLKEYPDNRLINHIILNCVREYACPAARNFALGRYEAPLPTSRACDARCVGCISQIQEQGAAKVTPQCRLAFVPTAEEVTEVMRVHASREKVRPVFSFGQGCEGDPLANAGLLRESIELYRSYGGKGTINCNTNASNTEAVAELCDAGLTSLRVSLNSSIPEQYEAYYRPVNYSFDDVRRSIAAARKKGVFVSLNLLYFPGITDTEPELRSLANLCAEGGVSMIQWRNLNIDPGWYQNYMADLAPTSPAMGFNSFARALRESCPWLRYGYFNPWLGERAEIIAPALV